MANNFVISFVSQKGGVGKSTFARATAVEIKKAGYSVKIADLDTQQGTCIDWHRRRLDADIDPCLDSVECYKGIKTALKDANGFDFVIVDGTPRSSKGTLEICKASDIVIQPSGASIDDLAPAVLLFHELSEAGVDRDKLFIGLCRVGTEAEVFSAHHYISAAGFAALNGGLMEKACYRQAQNIGKTVLETPFPMVNKKADLFIQNLIDHFQNLVKG